MKPSCSIHRLLAGMMAAFLIFSWMPTAQAENESTEIIAISQAKALPDGTENVTIRGTVIFAEGIHVVIQGVGGGMALFFGEDPGLIPGDAIQVTGTKQTVHNQPQLQSITQWQRMGTANLPYTETTLTALLADREQGTMESTRVLIRGVTLLTEAGMVTLTDGTVAIIIADCPDLPEVSSGDKVDVYAVVEEHEGYQLRISDPADISVAEPPTGPEAVQSVSHLDKIYLYHPASGMVLTELTDGAKLSAITGSIIGDRLQVSGEMTELTLVKEGDFFYLVNAAGMCLTSGEAGGRLYFDAPSRYGLWQLEATEDGFCIRSAYAQYQGAAQSLVYYYGFNTYGDESHRFHIYKSGVAEESPLAPPVHRLPGVTAELNGYTLTLGSSVPGVEIYYAVSYDGLIFTPFRPYAQPLTLAAGFSQVHIMTYSVMAGYQNSETLTYTFRETATPGWNLYFGQLHSHTGISDGTGTPTEAFAYASQVPGLDFFAVTDHSNAFDRDEQGVLSQDGTAISQDWANGQAAAVAATDTDFVALYGFEMTFQNGLGHISTFNTPGWQSRNQAQYQSYRTGLENYYTALCTVPGSISQFNHPGEVFGNFEDFGHYSPEADARITLIEVGNGDVNGSPETAYDQYNRALDLGWHLAPTNNQNNHAGNWGTASSCRTVVLASELTPEGIYDAMGNYRVYATEDSDLHIYYTLEDSAMGSILDRSQVGDTVSIQVTAFDNTDLSVGKVEVIVEGGKVLAGITIHAASQTVCFDLPAEHRYYYIRITQPDGDTAVTAPVWINQTATVEILDFQANSMVVPAGVEQGFTLEIQNLSNTSAEISSIIITDQTTNEILHTSQQTLTIPAMGKSEYAFSCTFSRDGVYPLTAGVTCNGQVCTRELRVIVRSGSVSADVIIDGTHGNDDFDRMENLTALAAENGIWVHAETLCITPDMLLGCELLIITAPGEDYEFEPEFRQMLTSYIHNGGSIIFCGASDSRFPNSSGKLNQLLVDVGASMFLSDNEVRDVSRNSGSPSALYLTDIRADCSWSEDVITPAVASEGEMLQQYHTYGGCSIRIGNGNWLVRSFDTTLAIDGDGDGTGSTGPGNLITLAWEDTGYDGNIFLAGSAFLSDGEMGGRPANHWMLPTANLTIMENILGITRTQPEVTAIAQVREAAAGSVFLIEGCVTAGTANPYTDFADTMYLQDATGGIALHSYDGPMLPIGTMLQVTGNVVVRSGDIGMEILSYRILDEQPHVFLPTRLGNRDAMDYPARGGQLLQIEGVVVDMIPTTDGRGAAKFTLQDDRGEIATVIIEPEIASGITGKNTLADFVQPGNRVSVIGLLYRQGNISMLRVRDCEEVILIHSPTQAVPESTPGASDQKPSSPDTGDDAYIREAKIAMISSGLGLLILLLDRKRFCRP